jgi:carboxyl-terminal processing protease
MEKQVSKRKSITLLIVTNIATAIIVAAIAIFAPKLELNGGITVGDSDYTFLNKFQKLAAVKDKLKDIYVDYDKVDEDKLVDGAISGMVNSIGDPYTVYLNKSDYTSFMTPITGSYAGIGIYVSALDGNLVVVAPIEDTPAAEAGLKSGDIISKVDGTDVSGSDMDKAISMMKGTPGTEVTLTIYREGEGNKDVTMKRATITLKTVKHQMLKNNIGYIRITTFDENTADNFKAALDDLKASGMKGLIIDLRDNPGGLLSTSTKIADMLLGKGTIVYTIDANGKREDTPSDDKKLDMPLTLLVNGGSASASEIVSGAVRDFDAGTLIGTKTFGKGVVQSIFKLGDGTGLKVTSARYYTPSGECIQGIGITPDIVVELNEAQQKKYDEGTLDFSEDPQTLKAIETIKSKF